MIRSSEWSSSSAFPTKVMYASLYCPTHVTHYAEHHLHKSPSPVTRAGRYVCKNAHIHRQAELQRWLIISGFRIWMSLQKTRWCQEAKYIHVTQFRFYCQATCLWMQKYLTAPKNAWLTLSNTLKAKSFLLTSKV